MRMNVRGITNKNMKGACVYRYIDISDGEIKYVGIVHKSDLKRRISDHLYRDDWCAGKNWKIEYFECKNRSEAEAFESHLISMYETWKYYNKSKSTWGINRFLPDVEKWWKPVNEFPFSDCETLEMSIVFRKALRKKDFDLAKAIYEIFDFSE